MDSPYNCPMSISFLLSEDSLLLECESHKSTRSHLNCQPTYTRDWQRNLTTHCVRLGMTNYLANLAEIVLNVMEDDNCKSRERERRKLKSKVGFKPGTA